MEDDFANVDVGSLGNSRYVPTPAELAAQREHEAYYRRQYALGEAVKSALPGAGYYDILAGAKKFDEFLTGSPTKTDDIPF